MNMGDQEIVEELTEEIGKSLEIWGFQPIVGKTWATLYLKGNMTQDDLKKDLSVGLSSISTSLTILQNLGSIKIVDKKGRKNIYSVVTSVHETIKKRMDTALRFNIEPMKNLMASRALELTNKDTKAKVNELKNKYSKIANLIKLVLKFCGK